MKANKRFKNAVAGTVALAILLTGTFAWQSFDQVALNEVLKEVGAPGGRLHDDFDGSDKNVYIENYASNGEDGYDDERGADVFARIRFQEYLAYGEDATKIDESFDTSRLTVIRGDKQLSPVTPIFNDKSTWDVYLFGSVSDENVESIRTYRDLKFSDGTQETNFGKTDYLPTFNKNIYSLEAEVNGTYEGADGLRHEGDRYDDYKYYVVGKEVTDNAQYTLNDDYRDGDLVLNVDYEEKNETHQIQSTLTASTLSMTAWRALGSPVGEYWVYDDDELEADGWAYWAQPIEPQTATGILLDEIIVVEEPEEEWYYGVHVEAQIATAGDWGILGDDIDQTSTGIYADYTEDGLSVLNRAANILTVRNMEISKQDDTAFNIQDTEIKVGEYIDLKVDFEVINGVGDESEELVTWSVEGVGTVTSLTQEEVDATIVANEKSVTFTPVYQMAGGTFNIVATSVLDPTKSTSVQLNVYTTATVYIDTTTPTTVFRGETANYTATVNGLVNQGVTWEITSYGHHANTKINEATGALYISSQEPMSSVSIRAKSIIDDAFTSSIKSITIR